VLLRFGEYLHVRFFDAKIFSDPMFIQSAKYFRISGAKLTESNLHHGLHLGTS